MKYFMFIHIENMRRMMTSLCNNDQWEVKSSADSTCKHSRYGLTSWLARKSHQEDEYYYKGIIFKCASFSLIIYVLLLLLLLLRCTYMYTVQW